MKKVDDIKKLSSNKEYQQLKQKIRTTRFLCFLGAENSKFISEEPKLWKVGVNVEKLKKIQNLYSRICDEVSWLCEISFIMKSLDKVATSSIIEPIRKPLLKIEKHIKLALKTCLDILVSFQTIGSTYEVDLWSSQKLDLLKKNLNNVSFDSLKQFYQEKIIFFETRIVGTIFSYIFVLNKICTTISKLWKNFFELKVLILVDLSRF